MKEAFTRSVYTMEPKSLSGTNCWNDGHWNYQWSGRNSSDRCDSIRCRKEADGLYLVQDLNGVVWMMDDKEFHDFQKEHPNAVA